jgi:hypothetical protein
VYNPAGPAPVIKTDIPVKGCREILEMSMDSRDVVISLKKLIIRRKMEVEEARQKTVVL